MKRDRKVFLWSIAVQLLGISIGALVVLSPHISIRVFGSIHNLDIGYKRIESISLDGIRFTDLSVLDKAKRIGVSAEDAAIKMPQRSGNGQDGMLGFDLQNVRFIDGSPDATVSLDSLDDLVRLPFSDETVYKRISGRVRSDRGGVTVKDFKAEGDEMKLTFSGTITPDNKVDSDIVLYFSETITKALTLEMTKIAFNSEDNGWKSLSVKLEGDFNAPRIQVSSRLFRLNIAVKE